MPRGEFIALIGPTGCGKTTLLNAVAGFISPSSGRLEFDGTPIRGPDWRRGMVFQDHALFPWMTASANVAFGPSVRGIPRERRNALVQHYLELVGLKEFAARLPHELSGGMKQRIGLARALANQPELLLMDEPFGSLDALTREQMQEELLRIWLVEKKTVLFVTHGVDEAVFLADRIAVFSKRPGRIVDEIRVDLERPRRRDSVEFGALARKVRTTLDRGNA